MTSTVQSSSKTVGLRRRAASAALALSVILLAAVGATRSAQAQTFTLLYQFTGGMDGGNPLAGLVEDGAGNFYGTTSGGGVIGGTCKILVGCGVVFKLDTAGKETVLYRFTGLADGADPVAALILDASGNLYGTTISGGASAAGTVFKLDTAGKETVLYSFAGSPDGANPHGGLVLDAAGNLYGTTYAGGASGFGTAFKLDTTGTETVLHSFMGQPDGAGPQAGLALDPAGTTLYGTTLYGGISGFGTVFKLDTAGSNYGVLYSFSGTADGGSPYAGLVLDPAGNLYGTASSGGALNCLGGQNNKVGCGLVFKVNSVTGIEGVYNFTAGGDFPVAGLVQDTAGNLYGTTEFTARAGTNALIFKMNETSGAETVLFNFTGGGLDRSDPVGSLVLAASGTVLYGATEFGGSYGAGTVFKFDPSGPANFPLTVAPAGNGSGIVTSNPPVIDCPSSCSAFLFPGTALTLAAAPAAGSSFSGWTGPCSGKGACNLATTNSAEVVFATFILDFALSAGALTPATVTPGSPSTSTVNVTAQTGFNSAVALTCSVQPTPALAPTCSITPSSTSPGTPATLTVGTTPPTASALRSSGGSGLFYAVWLPLIGLVVTRVGFRSGQKRKGTIAAGMLAGILLTGLFFQVACGGSSSMINRSSGTPAGTYTITVTGTSGSLKHSTTAMLKVE